jgi:Ca2+-binding RTX toxin-like protein
MLLPPVPPINIITGNNLNGTSASEVLIGGTGDDTINGGSGHVR